MPCFDDIFNMLIFQYLYRIKNQKRFICDVKSRAINVDTKATSYIECIKYDHLAN